VDFHGKKKTEKEVNDEAAKITAREGFDRSVLPVCRDGGSCTHAGEGSSVKNKTLKELQIGDSVNYHKIILLGKEEYFDGIVIHVDEVEGILLDTGDRITGVDKDGNYYSLDFEELDNL